jgi:outer membrane protein assembly factor BamB
MIRFCALIGSFLYLALFLGCAEPSEPAAPTAADTGGPPTKSDWPNFRGPRGSGVSEEKDLPITWSDKENLVWKIDLPGPGSSSPIVWGDKVFVTCYTGYGLDGRNPGDQSELARHLVCVDRKEGKVLWDREVKAALPEARYGGPYITKHGYASSTPATDGERVYVFHGKTSVLA